MHYTRNLSYFYIWEWGVGVALAPAHKMCCARPCAVILLSAGQSIDLNFLVNIKSNNQGYRYTAFLIDSYLFRQVNCSQTLNKIKKR